jgi:PAS domain S-box-containing protein
MSFSKSKNIAKIKSLVEELSIRDQEVFEMKQVLEQILETSTDGYWDWHIEKGYEYLSPRFKKQLGYEDNEMDNCSTSWKGLINDNDLDKILIELKKHFDSKGAYPFKVICRYTHRDGHEVTVLRRGTVIEWDNDKPIRMVGTHIDITNL